MSCAHQESLTAYLDHELSSAQVERLQSHLATCNECRATLALLQTATARLKELPPIEPSVGMRRMLLNRLSNERQQRSVFERWRGVWLLPILGGSAAAIIALGITQHAAQGTMLQMAEPGGIELAANFEVVRDMDVLGLERPEDFEVIEHLDELEATP
jgi:anti-sigma factor RsiW